MPNKAFSDLAWRCQVVQLVQQGGGDDSLLQQAWDQIGDYFGERQKTAKAAQYYAQAKNMEALVACYYKLEDFNGLEKLIGALPEGSPLLQEIGQKFSSVGMSTEAVSAYLKCGDVKAAVDCCVQQHQWESAVQLAEAHSYPGIQKVLSQYASRLLSQGKKMHAIELYRKANRYTDAAKLLSTLGAEVRLVATLHSPATQMHPSAQVGHRPFMRGTPWERQVALM